MGSTPKDETMDDPATGRKEEELAPVPAGGDGKIKDKDSPQFSEGDKVLAYHGPLIYEAKIQKAEFRKKEWKYFVHYLGWSKNWDEWVGTDRLMALTDANLEMQKKLFKSQNVDKQSKGRLAQGRQKAPTDSRGEKEGAKINSVPKGKKRKAESTISEEKDADEPDHIMKIPLSAVLKRQLVDDWELIQSGKLIKLPRSPNVVEILKKYREFKTKQENIDGDSLGEILSGIQSYFDKSLPAMLLYKHERPQYVEAIPNGSKLPSLVYGAEHLLRLFVKLPDLLVYINMEEETLTRLQHKFMDFLKFLQKHQSSFFLSMYDGPKVRARVEPEEKKYKRDLSRVLEDRKDRRDLLQPIDEKREKRIGPKVIEEKREKRDGFKLPDDKKDRKDASRFVDEKRERKDGPRSFEEKRERMDGLKVTEDKKERRDGFKAFEDKKERKSTEDKKERRDGARPLDDKKERKDSVKPSEDRKEKVGFKFSEDKRERKDGFKFTEEKRKDALKVLEEKKEKKDSSKLSEGKKEKDESKLLDDKKDKRDGTKLSEDKKEKRDSSKPTEDKKDVKESTISLQDKKERRDVPKSLDDRERKDSSKSSLDNKEKKDSTKSFDDKKEKKDGAKPSEDSKEMKDGSKSLEKD